MQYLCVALILVLLYNYIDNGVIKNMKKTLKDYNYKGKRVIVRCDLNVPMNSSHITDDTRIIESLSTINYLIII